MARKPKAASSNDLASSPEEVLGDAPAPARRGRKPTAAASPEPLATMDSDGAAGGTIAGLVAAPVRKRPGPKPKQRAGAAEAVPAQKDAAAKSGQEARASDATPEPMLVADDKSDAGSGGQQDQQEHVRGNELATSNATFALATSGAASWLLSGSGVVIRVVLLVGI